MKFSGLALILLAWNSYTYAAPPTGRYKVVVDKMKQLAATYPDLSQIFSLGSNDDDVEILALRVSLTPQAPNPTKIAHLVVSTHHGNELKATDFTLYWAEELLKKYASQQLFRANLIDTEWTIIPVLNVSGYNASNRHEHGWDPNRDYPGPCTPDPGGRLKSVRLLMDHLRSRAYVGTVTVHGYIGTLTFPWGVNTSNTHSHDHNAFERVTRGAAQFNGYRFGTSTDIVYPCDGSYEDYAYWKHGMWALLLELRNGSESDIKQTAHAIFYYFDNIDSSPSVKNQLTGNCQRAGKLDLRNE